MVMNLYSTSSELFRHNSAPSHLSSPSPTSTYTWNPLNQWLRVSRCSSMLRANMFKPPETGSAGNW